MKQFEVTNVFVKILKMCGLKFFKVFYTKIMFSPRFSFSKIKQKNFCTNLKKIYLKGLLIVTNLRLLQKVIFNFKEMLFSFLKENLSNVHRVFKKIVGCFN